MSEPDPYRVEIEKRRYREEVGIFTRALLPNGRFKAVDISSLDLPSLKRYLRARGGANTFAERVVALVLGHHPKDVNDAWGTQEEER